MTDEPPRDGIPDDQAGMENERQAFMRVPPHDQEAEQAVLGGMLLVGSHPTVIDDVMEALGKTGHEAFYKPIHAMIYSAIIDMYARDEPIDVLTLTSEMTKRGLLPKIGGAGYLHQLVQVVPTAANAEYYAEIVHDKFRLRRIIQSASRVVEWGYAQTGEVDDLVNAVQSEMFAATEDVDRAEDYQVVGSLLEAALDEIESNSARNGALSGVPTGYVDLDGLTHGLQEGQMIVIAGRPASGKSTVALDIARHVAIKRGLPAVFFSLEMNRNELVMRCLSAEGRVALHHMRGGSMTDDDWTKIAHTTSRVNDAPLYIDDSPNMSMHEIRSKCRRLAQQVDLKLVVIDYLQLMQASASGKRPESRQQEVSDISRNIKLLAKELRVPIIALSQLNRGPEQRTDKKPMVSDLRESGSIEQDADVVILVHREDMYEKESPRAGEADLIVAKHRNGPTATITLAFQGHYSRFVDMTGEAF